MPNTFSIALADSAAIGHVNAGLDLYRRFASLPGQREKLDDADFFAASLQCGIPAITNMALGLELLMKLHHFQIVGAYPRGHDISALGMSYPPTQLEILRCNYARWHANPNVDKGLEFRFSGGPPGQTPPEWERVDAATYDQAIAYVGTAFVQWRYFYEQFRDDIRVSFSFFPLYFAAMSVHEAIRGYKGTTRVTIK